MSLPTDKPVVTPTATCAISSHFDTRTAASEVSAALYDEIGLEPDLVLVFASYHHRAAMEQAIADFRRTLSPRTIMGVTAESVLGESEELDGLAGLSAIAFRLPEVRIDPWSLTPNAPLPLRDPEQLRNNLNIAEDTRCLLMFGDPFSTPITKLMPAFNSVGMDGRSVPVIGGLASGSSQPGQNVLVQNDLYTSAGVVGVTISGRIEVDFVLSQGCRPIGAPMVVTKAHNNVILELGGRKAMEALQEVATSLNDQERKLLTQGLLVGSVLNEYKRHFGRGDFLIRNVLGFDQRVGGIAVGDMPRIGGTVQFHVRDAATADEDLQLLLDAQQLDDPPFGALLFTCNSRGQRFFRESNHDLNVIRRRLHEVPIAGFFAAGELGPIGDRSYLHGHTASLALFR